MLNPGSFVTTTGPANPSDSDEFRYTSGVDRTPARLNLTQIVISANGVQTTGSFDNSHLHDNTAYAANPIEDSWQVRLSGSGSPANTNGSIRGGQLT